VATNAGIRVTQPGVSVPYAADYQYVFNSDWPSLAIAFETVVSVGPYAALTVPHNLGFYPLTMGWTLLGGVSIGRSFAQSGNLAGPQTGLQFSFDKTNIYFSNYDASVTYGMSIKCYNIDISKSVDYTLPKFPVISTVYDPSTGIKVTKYSKSMGSTDLRDYILHSRAQSPAVLSIVHDSPSVTYTNPVGYTPWVLAFISNDGGSTYFGLAPGTQQANFIFTIAGAVSSLGSATTNPCSIVVLRDPLVIAKTKQVIF